jgi:predicted enzyme related to lactoylglutathione lyase
MPEGTSYVPGTPSWVDLGTSDPDAAKRFYGELFGWEAEDAGPVEQTGGYAFFTCRGRNVAGVGPLQDEQQPTAWSVYVSTDDIEGVVDRVRQAGGMVMVEPMDVMGSGRLAFFGHPGGGMLGAWEPATHIGAELVNEPNSFTWCELHTHDTAGGREFATSVFGWRADDQDFGGTTYTTFYLGDHGVAGMVAFPPEVPQEVPAHWAVFFAVADCDATVARVKELGGSVLLEPLDAPGVGRFSMVTDTQGAQLGVIAVATPVT